MIEANSTSTLIRSDRRLMVVDPSSRMMRPAIKTVLQADRAYS
ncbi:MAG: hypothetical protein ACOX10_04450 [Candidatus Methanomethylophilaceae archaeon]